MTKLNVVDREQWLEQRLVHLEAEKALDRQRDALSRARRALPCVRIDTEYMFQGPDGRVTLADLFAGCHQLIVYHFMFHLSWGDSACPSCSYLADHFDGVRVHLAQRDTSLAAVSKAGIEQIERYRRRMGWQFPWVSSLENDFNREFEVSFDPEALSDGVRYNYRDGVEFPSEEAPGASVFYRNEDGSIYHTYSTYGRGLDRLIGAYHFLDMTPKGRDEDDFPFPMAWVRRHDEYE